MTASGSMERRRTENEARARGRLAMVAFLAHAPGLYLLARRTLVPAWVRYNALALVATFAAMGVAFLALRERGQVGVGIAAVWLLGHFAWSLGLAWGVLKGRALKDRRVLPR